MRKLIGVSIFVGAVAIISLHSLVDAGPPPARETRVPGDTNCDGKLDLSDAVFTLNYLFVGTAFPPCPLADPPELVARIAGLEAQLAQKSAALEASTAEVLSLQADLAEKNGALAACQTSLSDCSTSLSDYRRRRIPATGQARCFTPSGAEIRCDDATCPGQDGFYRTGCQSEDRFMDNGDGTVTDSCTGLMWQQNTADVNGDGETIDDQNDALRWCEALAHCENLSFAGHYDWRLPNVRELESIVDNGRYNPSIDPVFGALGNAYWSSTTEADGLAAAWGVNFFGGYRSGGWKGGTFYVRAVRSGEPAVACAGSPELTARIAVLEAELAQRSTELTDCTATLSDCRRRRLPATGQMGCFEPSGLEIPCDDATCPGEDGFYRTGCPREGRFVDNADGTVTDTCAGLMWQRSTADVNGDGQINVEGDAIVWCEALTYCENLSYAGHDDWRLPNALELQSIVDYGRFDPAIDPVFGALSQLYWSSTTQASVPNHAWYLSFYNGYFAYDVKRNISLVRAVRNAP